VIAPYNEARKNKCWKINTLQFSRHLERNCLDLKKEVDKRCYHIKPSLSFIAFAPVKREIFAGDFSDRIVHHLIFEELNQHYDSLFINDCYSCRKCRGTGYGIERASKFLRSVSSNNTKTAYVMKLDIAGYFMNIDRKKLYEDNKKLISRFFIKNPNKKNLLLYLLKKIIFNNPTTNCYLRGDHSDWKGLPKNKSLFYAPPGKGLPIGNLTSQLFGNVYLNDFDHFIKEKLKCRYYGRYVDDMIFMHEDKEYLKALIPKIDNYLQKNLGLNLHPKKIYLQDINKGLPFLGMIIKPHSIYPGKRIRHNFINALHQAKKTKKGIESVNSYLGMMKNYNSYKFRKKHLESPLGEQALKGLNARVNDDYTIIKKNFYY